MNGPIEARVLPLAGSVRAPLRWMIAIGAIPFVIVIAVLWFVVMREDAAHRPVPLLALIAIPVLVLAAHAFLLRGMARAGVALAHGELIVNTGLGMRRIALTHLRRHGVRVVDLDTQRELRPWLRTWGAGLPGYRAGWFRLRNGDKALCLLFGDRGVTCLRSDQDDLTLLLSLADPETLRAALTR